MTEVVSQGEPGVVDVAVQLLRAGELIVYPTDTLYGLGAAAGDEEAVRRLYAAKGRPPGEPLPLLIGDTAMASWIADMSPVAHQLATRFWPGPLTIVVRKQPQFRSLALAGKDTVGLRVPDADVVRSIIKGLREPITGTSANRSGNRDPRSAQEVAFQLGDMVALVIDGGPVRSGTASTVVDVTAEGGPTILRQGGVTREEIEQALGKKIAQ